MKLLNLLHKHSKYVLYAIMAFHFVLVSHAQITILEPNLDFTQACASPGFNTYNFSFSFYPAQNLGSNNQFIVEMSDANGNFNSATTVQTLTNNTSPVSGSFTLPTDTAGENYKIRIRSTNPAQTSPESVSFSAYYAIHNQPFSINNYNSTVNLCEGETVFLEVDDTGTPASPVYYPYLQYIWYKDYVEIPNETNSSFLVTEPGSYYCVVDYGSCVMNSYSNIVTVGIAPDISPTIETSDGFSSICPSESKTLISILQDSSYNYTWFKDNVAIANSNAATFDATEEGIYHLEIDNGGCVFQSNSIFLEVTDVDLYLDTASNVMLIPGETQNVTATTDAQTPSIQWYKDNTVIAGATNLMHTITEPGEYKIVVSQTTPCAVEKEAIIMVIHPDEINIAINTDASYTACSSSSTTLQPISFDAVSSIETLNILGNNLGYIYQWYHYGVPIFGSDSTSHTVSSSEANGPYFLEVTIPGFGVIYSNNLNVNLGIDTVTISNDRELCNSQTVTLSSNYTATNYNYQWYKDNAPIAGATASTHATTEAGSYYLEIISGTCQNTSNIITLTENNFTVTATAATSNIIIPGETKTLSVSTTASTPTFEWYRNNVLIAGATSNTYNATQNGTYKVTVTQTGACNLDSDIVFQLDYPTGFNIQIATDSAYQACSSNQVDLQISEFLAVTNSGNIDILNNTFNYNYQWLKNGTAITGANNNMISILDASDNGTYSLEVSIPDFGTLTTNSLVINLATEAIVIENSGSFCPGQSTTLSANVSNTNFSYQWFFNGTAISGATTYTYSANQEGNYELEVQNGSCNTTSNSLSLVFGQINIFSSNPDTDVILPGENKTISVTTDASQPNFEWYRDNVLLNGETAASFTATESGSYKVIANQTLDCSLTSEKTFILEDPIYYNIQIAIDANYDSCSSNSLPINLITFEAITNSGSIDILNNPDITYTAQWFKNSTLVSNETNTTISLTESADNGAYHLELNIPNFGSVSSNVVTANLDTNQPLIITSSGLFCTDSPQLDINSNITNSAYSYAWYYNGTLLTTNNQATLSINQIGNYQLIIDTGSCTKESNILEIEESFISITPESDLENTITPGDTLELSVSTDALQPNFQWYLDGTLIPGANSATITVDVAGNYQVIVTQTIGCIMDDSLNFTVNNLTNFQATIAASADYEACISLNTTLAISDFTAESVNGMVDLSNNPYNYALQWYKDGVPITGETANTLTLTNFEANGEYHLTIEIPDIGTLVSNTVIINLGFLDAVTISSDDILCESNPEATLYSNVTDPQFNYQWYNESTNTTLGTETDQIVNEAGDYYLEVSFGNCIVTSNSLTISTLNGDDITLNHPDAINLIENTSITVTANGGDSYEWFFNGNSVSLTNSLVISEAGTYSLIAQIGNCEVTKTIEVTEVENKAVAIPNVVTLNNDGINDTWGLPNKYVAKENIDIIIYGPDGTVVFRQRNYMNNWPESDFKFSKKQPVYYYTILEDNMITEKGAITLIK